MKSPGKFEPRSNPWDLRCGSDALEICDHQPGQTGLFTRLGTETEDAVRLVAPGQHDQIIMGGLSKATRSEPIVDSGFLLWLTLY